MHTHSCSPLVILACLIVLSGCGESSDDQASSGSAANAPAGVEVSDNRVEITTGQGTVSVIAGEGVRLPDNFPKDIYVYEGAQVLASMSMPQGQMLTLETDDPAAKVADAYSTGMTKAGWNREMAMDSGAGKMFAYRRDKRHVQITIATDEDTQKTTISVVAGSEE